VSVGPSTIGERIRQLRLQRDPQMTQRELAERAGVSVDLISKLEQGRKQTALLVSLHKIARALDVDASMLLARPSRIDVADDAQDHGVLAIRRALWLAPDPPPFAEIDEQQDVVAALAQLTPRQRAALVLTDVLDYSSEEAGRALGVSAGTVRGLASRARENLRRQVGERT